MGLKFSVDGAGGVSGGGDGWRLVPGDVWAVLEGLREDFDLLGVEAGRLGGADPAVSARAASSTLQQAVWQHGPGGAPSVTVASVDYRTGPEWGMPFGGAVAVALDEALGEQSARLSRAVCQVSAAVVGVQQATAAYQNGQEDMVAAIQSQAVAAASTGSFSYFDYLTGP